MRMALLNPLRRLMDCITLEIVSIRLLILIACYMNSAL